MSVKCLHKLAVSQGLYVIAANCSTVFSVIEIVITVEHFPLDANTTLTVSEGTETAYPSIRFCLVMLSQVKLPLLMSLSLVMMKYLVLLEHQRQQRQIHQHSEHCQHEQTDDGMRPVAWTGPAREQALHSDQLQPDTGHGHQWQCGRLNERPATGRRQRSGAVFDQVRNVPRTGD